MTSTTSIMLASNQGNTGLDMLSSGTSQCCEGDRTAAPHTVLTDTTVVQGEGGGDNVRNLPYFTVMGASPLRLV